jgi:hypothetical protein
MPQLQGDATEQTPPDLPSYLFKERIVYLVRFQVPVVHQCTFFGFGVPLFAVTV